LGASCGTCHARGNFASETNPRKAVARRMLEMTKAINQQFFADYKVEDGSSRLGRITCYTCHQGELHPKPQPPLYRRGICSLDIGMRDAQRFPDGHTACTHHPGSRNLMEVRMNRTVVSGAVTACGFAVVLSAVACSDRNGNRTATGNDEQARPPVTMTG